MTGYLWFWRVPVLLWCSCSGTGTFASLSTSELLQPVENVTQQFMKNVSMVKEGHGTTENVASTTTIISTLVVESNKSMIYLDANSSAEINNVSNTGKTEEKEETHFKTELETMAEEEKLVTKSNVISGTSLSKNSNTGKESFGSLFDVTDNLPTIAMNTGVATNVFMSGNSTMVNPGQDMVFYETTTPSPVISVWNYSSNTNALSMCYQMVKGDKPSGRNMPFRFFTGMSGQKFAETWMTTPWDRLVHIIIRFNYIGVVKEDGKWSNLCVGTYDMTAHTYWGEPNTGGQPVAWVTIHTLSQLAVGIVRLGTRCFRQTTQFQDCSPEYYSLPFMENIPIFKYSVLEEEFWTRLSYTAMGVKFPWIWRINTNINTSTHFNNIPTNWIYKMDIPTLDELEILGNNWGKFKKLIRPIPTLASLDLSNNNMEIVPEGILRNTPFLRKLVLSYNNLSEYPVEIKYLKELKYLDISFSKCEKDLRIEDESINNISQRLKVLKLENTRLKVNISNFFSLSQMTSLNLSRCRVRLIGEKESDLRHRSILRDSNLTELDLSKNYISALTLDSFARVSHLEIIYLSSNVIENIDTDTFQYNLLLKKIDLSYNKIKYVPKCLFCELNKLENVDLSHNQLSKIPDFVNVKLSYLGLSFNALSNFKQNYSSIDHIDMSNNNVSLLQISLVKKLNLSYNWLSVITTELWGNITRLQEVDLGGNNFECCSFETSAFLKETYDTKIFNLGSSIPLTCKISTGITEFLLGTLDSKYSSCTNKEENGPLKKESEIILGVAVVVIIFFFLITLFLAGKRIIFPCSHQVEMKGIYI